MFEWKGIDRRIYETSVFYYHLRSTVKREAWTFFRAGLIFKRDSLPDNCIDWTNEKFRLEHEAMNDWRAGLTKLTTFFRVLEAWCHCDFRKIEALIVNKFGRTYRTGAPATQTIVVANVRLVKTMWHSYRGHRLYITTKFHYAKRGSSYGGVMYGKYVNRHFSRNFDLFVTKKLTSFPTSRYAERRESFFA